MDEDTPADVSNRSHHEGHARYWPGLAMVYGWRSDMAPV